MTREPKAGTKTRRTAKAQRSDAALPDMLSPMSIENLLAGLVGSRGAESDLNRAQDLIYSAWEAPTLAKRVALAKKALKVSPLCADAHNILAEAAPPGSDEEMEQRRRAVEAGAAALGEAAFAEDVGHFWGLLETRPYMRSRFGLATALWARGAREEAIGHGQEMLRLNPNDNQGVRYTLASWLLETGRDAELEKLFKAYRGDGSAAFAWPAALAAFRKDGDGAKSRKRLDRALASNGHVPAYLFGDRKLPKNGPPYIGVGDENEAVAYVMDGRESWLKTPGALEWLLLQSAKARQKRPAAKAYGRGVPRKA